MEFYESFMKFSFNDDDIFRIEDDPLVVGQQSIEACECVVLLRPNIALIEAKASSPQPINCDKFDPFIQRIKQKFQQSLKLFNEIKDRQYGEEAYLRLPVNLQGLKISPDQYLICLIIHGHKLDWLLGLQDAFRDALREVIHQWNIKDSNVKVFNEEIALERQLIVAYIPKSERDSIRESNGNMNPDLAKQWFDNH